MVARRLLPVVLVLVAACSGEHGANPSDTAAARPTDSAPDNMATSSGPGSATSAGSTASSGPGASTGPSGPTASSGATTTTASPLSVTGRAIAGAAGGVEPGGPPYAQTDAFSEAVRLADGTCVGWAESRGGSTAGLVTGAPVVLLDSEDNQEIGSGTITASRWEDMAAGGEQWNCIFEFEATLTAPHAEFRVRVAALAPWLARDDPAAPGTFVASVSTDASIGLIPECPAVAAQPASPSSSSTSTSTSTTAVPTTTGPPVTGWSAIGQYWSRGVQALCGAGLPVTAIARPCRPPNAGSEYITEVVNSDDPTERYADGAPIPAGTELTVVVPVGRACV